MSNMLLVYIIWSLLIGVCYFSYWFKYELPIELKGALRSRRVLIYVLVFVMSSIGAPLSAIELLYKVNFKNRETTKENKK